MKLGVLNWTSFPAPNDSAPILWRWQERSELCTPRAWRIFVWCFSLEVFALQQLEIINCKYKNTVCSLALEMRHFVDGISMNFARFISCGTQAVGLAWTNIRDGIGAEPTYRSQDPPGKKEVCWLSETWDLSCRSNSGRGVWPTNEDKY